MVLRRRQDSSEAREQGERDSPRGVNRMNKRNAFIRWSRAAVQLVVALTLILSGVLALPGQVAADTAPVWTGYYYNNVSLSGSPVLTRGEAALSFNWGTGAPGAGVPADYFSAQWAGSATLDGGTYTFSAWADDGIRVWVDDVILINEWHNHLPTTYTASRYLAPGYHTFRVAYYEATGNAAVNLTWTRGTPPPATGTTIVVDDRSPGFIWGGPASGWRTVQWGYNGWMYWTKNSASGTYNWGKWYPYVGIPGNYEVQVYVPSRYGTTTRANYVINLNGAQHVRTVNQNIYYSQWVSLGSFWFGGGAGEFVYLSDFTGEPHATKYMAYDAIRFIKDGGGAPPPPPPPACSIIPTMGFGRIWSSVSRVQAGLGCATEAEKTIWMGEQTFIAGRMFWRSDNTQIYVLNANGTWQQVADTWTAAEPEWDTGIVAPAGYYQPKRGFGKVWRNVLGVRSALNWGTIEERGFNGAVQSFSNGLMIYSPWGGIYVLYGDGRWERFS